MLIAIAQLRMHWTGEENTAAIVTALGAAAAAGTRLCVFPELALTGFHRQIATLAKPALVQPWLRAVQDACAAHTIAAAVGAPTFDTDGRIYNSHVLIDRAGRCIASIDKRGLTPAEATFFAPGRTRAVVEFEGLRCTSVLCREIEDLSDLTAQLPTGIDLIFWPGIMRPAVDTPNPDPDAHVKHAQRLAREVAAFIVQANWPNSLNYPAESEHAGQSAVIDRAGGVSLRLPRAQAGVAVFALGEPSYRWIASETMQR